MPGDPSHSAPSGFTADDSSAPSKRAEAPATESPPPHERILARLVLGFAAEAALLLGAWMWLDSRLLWLALGVAPALFLDRQVFHLVGRPAPNPWRDEIPRRLMWFAAGAVFVAAVGWRWVLWTEYFFWPAVLSFTVFLGEWLAAFLAGAKTSGPRRPLRLAGFVLVFLLAVAFVAPLTAFHPIRIPPGYRPSDEKLAYEEVEFDAADGVRLSGWLIPAAGGPARGNLIYCHGHQANRGQMLYLLGAFAKLRVNILAFDFRGHGLSGSRSATFGQRETLDLFAARDFLVNRCPGQPLVLVGVSYGASVILQALPQLPQAKAAWLDSPFVAFLHVGEHKFQAMPPALRDGLLWTYRGLLWVDCGFDAQRCDASAGLPDCRTPLYVIHGEQDDLIPISESKFLLQRYGGPVQRHFVPTATHFNVFPSTPDYLERLERFLEPALR